MAWTWSLSITSLLKAYPEILFAIASFFIVSFYRDWRTKLPVNWPVVGMLPSLLAHFDDLHEYGLEILAASNWTIRFKGPWFSGMNIVFTCDPANVNHLFITKFSSYPKGKEFAEMFEIFGQGLLAVDGELWRMHRMAHHKCFKSKGFRSYELKVSRDKVEKVLLPLLHGLAEQNKVFDLQDVFGRLTLDLACSLFLGIDPGSLSDDFPEVPFAKALEDVEEVIVYRHMLPKSLWKTLKWLRVGGEKKMAMAHKVMNQFAAEAIRSRKERFIKSREGGEGRDKEEAVDMLSAYLQQPGDQRKNMLEFDRFIKDNALNLLLAGRDTTAITLSWFFWLLCKHPDVEQKILEELKENWPRTADKNRYPNTLDRDGLGKLIYLHAALCECLRLYPPAVLQHKGVTKPDTLPSGVKVHPGTILIVHLYSMGRMEGIWGKDCMEFKPERWITESGHLKHEPSHKFFSFGSGPRICLGKELAFIEMKTAAAALLYNFRFVLVKGHVVEPQISFMLHMKNGLMVKVSKREKSW